VGWLTAAIKDIFDTQIGDTITGAARPTQNIIPGFKPAQPVVCLRPLPDRLGGLPQTPRGVGKALLNDAAFTFEPETSEALGFGFRCGFLGPLHADIVQARLEREFDLGLIATAPAVIYEIERTDGSSARIQNPADLPEPDKIVRILSPM
jgi:GTP-binding protein LepA